MKKILLFIGLIVPFLCHATYIIGHVGPDTFTPPGCGIDKNAQVNKYYTLSKKKLSDVIVVTDKSEDISIILGYTQGDHPWLSGFSLFKNKRACSTISQRINWLILKNCQHNYVEVSSRTCMLNHIALMLNIKLRIKEMPTQYLPG